MSHQDQVITVVVATYGRADTLARTLDCLSRQDLEPARYEVIVISDKSPDHTAQVCRAAAEKAPYRLLYLENEANRGPGYSQNRGIRHAHGSVVLLMADDIFQSPGSLARHVEFHRQHSEPECAALGKVIQSPELAVMSVFLSKWDPFRFKELEGMSMLPAYRFWAANVSFKRDFMLEHGMFREQIGRAGPAAHEDVEIGYRLKEHGLCLHYLPEAWAWHYHVWTLEEAVARWRNRGLNYGEFRKLVHDPVLTVLHHDLRWRTFREYARALRGENPFRGREKSFAWHLFRECARRIVLNRLTVRRLWWPVLEEAEKRPWLARLLSTQVYRAFLYYHFLQGIREAHKIYGD